MIVSNMVDGKMSFRSVMPLNVTATEPVRYNERVLITPSQSRAGAD